MMNGLQITPQEFALEKRRAVYYDISKIGDEIPAVLSGEDERDIKSIDLAYRTLCGILFNFVPMSGHPGGSISSGRIVEALIFNAMDYNFSEPEADHADMLSYAAGHKAMGLYAMWALRNEVVRIARPDLLPAEKEQLRFEDLLGFRRNPTQETELFNKFNAKSLDGHPAPSTPFIKLSTGASGVGVPSSLGLAFGALDYYRDDPPRIHILEGEGGMTPGRFHEAIAAAATARIHNAVLHVDWNQASIDSNRVCREDGQPGDYVQWNPVELAIVHDLNAIYVPDGFDFQQILRAQKLAASIDNGQPTAIIYKTVKGWRYGIEGAASHGAGHKFCSDAFYKYLSTFEEHFDTKFPRFTGEATGENVEKAFWGALEIVRSALEKEGKAAAWAAAGVASAGERLQKRNRTARSNAPDLEKIYTGAAVPSISDTQQQLAFAPGDDVTLRGTLGECLNKLNKMSNGAIIGTAADLFGSTSVNVLARDFKDGFYDGVENPDARLIAVGGICEDAMGAFMSGLSTYGKHIGVTSSYGAFIGALEHVAARLHGIGQQARSHVDNGPYQTWILINAHAGGKTGEDGPTHADPQVLQLLQENFPRKVMITLTPWDPQEIWPLLIAGLQQRPAVLSPFVTRPAETIVDREAIGIPPAEAAADGMYAFRRADRSKTEYHGTLVLQGNGVGSEFINDVLPKMDAANLNMNVFYITSVELFDLLSDERREEIFPSALSQEAMGMTDFTIATMYRWIRNDEGLRRSLHSFKEGLYLGSGKAHKVLEEAGINAAAQWKAIQSYAEMMAQKK